MNRDEAQFILQAYRSNSTNAHDPQFQSALSLVKQDPELARWFAEELALDAAFGRKIRAAIPIPPDLKRQLLLARSTGQTRQRVRRLWLAMAATLAIFAASGGTWWWQQFRERQAVLFRDAMAQAALDMSNHADVQGLNGEPLRRWLGEHGGEPGFMLPAGLADKNVAACKIVDWKGSKVTMLCFMIGDAHLELFVVDAARVPNLAHGSTPQFASARGINTATWSRDGKVYMLAGRQPPAQLQRFI